MINQVGDRGHFYYEVHGKPPFVFRMHWDDEPRAVPRRTESADKSDALQTLRAVRRRPAVAKRLECVRLQRRFPKASRDSMRGSVHGDRKRALFDAALGYLVNPAGSTKFSCLWSSQSSQCRR